MADQNLAKKFNIKCPQNLDYNDRILVVEDQQDLRLIIVHHLSKMTYKNVVHRANGYEALEFMREDPTPIKAFIVDMDMPVMGGLDLLSELREQVDFQRSAFLLTMDQVSREKIMLAVESGVDEVLVKPFTFGDIAPKLKSAFKKFNNAGNPEQVYELAKKQMRDGKFDVAEQIYIELATHNTNAARPMVGIARINKARKDYKTALANLDEAAKRNEQFVHLYAERAAVFCEMEDWDAAIRNFHRAISMSPLNAYRYKEAADVLFQVKKFDVACQMLEKALSHEVSFPDLFHYLSQAKFALKDYKGAAKFIHSALSSDPENIVYLNQLGISLKELGMTDDAQKTYNQVIKLDPNNAPALYNKAVLQYAKGEIPEAIKTLDRLLKKHPGFGPAVAKKAEYEKEEAA